MTAAGSLGPWAPLGLEEVGELFRSFPGRWWISGGRALELHLGRSWRAHDDSDVSVLRDDVRALAVAPVLSGWDMHVAAAGVLAPWNGSPLSMQESQNNVWCRKAPDQPWCLDVTISDGDRDHWTYRRDPTIRVSWHEAVLWSEGGIPYLAPELQLLFKSKNFRKKDELDATEVIPELTEARRLGLHHLLPGDHPWQALLAG